MVSWYGKWVVNGNCTVRKRLKKSTGTKKTKNTLKQFKNFKDKKKFLCVPIPNQFIFSAWYSFPSYYPRTRLNYSNPDESRCIFIIFLKFFYVSTNSLMSGFSQFCIKMCSLKMLSGFGSHSPHTLHCNAESRSRSGLRFIWIRIQRVKIKPQIFRSQGGLPYNTGYGSFHFRSEVVPVSLLKDITFSHIPSLHPTSPLNGIFQKVVAILVCHPIFCHSL